MLSCSVQIGAELAEQLELARKVQLSLLPKAYCCLGDWKVALSYDPAGTLSGDYVDLIPLENGDFYFALGDVSGKGIAASILMSHLHATLRALIAQGLSVAEIVKTASHTFCESSLPAQFATLVLGRADQEGGIELVNAGHTPVLMRSGDTVELIQATDIPLGMFCATDFVSAKLHVPPGGALLLYSDGITEASDDAENEYGLNQLTRVFLDASHLPPSEVPRMITESVTSFTGDRQAGDDRTLLVIGR
jgi:sigma-B regulation protein RsbU (phosphoserine phosphatase)